MRRLYSSYPYPLLGQDQPWLLGANPKYSSVWHLHVLHFHNLVGYAEANSPSSPIGMSKLTLLIWDIWGKPKLEGIPLSFA